MNNQEEKIKASLFGEVKKIEAQGGFQVEKNLLSQTFEGKGSVVYSFCTGCGILGEMDIDGARMLCKEAGMEGEEMPESFAGQYFETGSCELCDSTDHDTSLKDIA